MPRLFEVEGTYGGLGKTPTTIFVYEQRDGSSWYAVEGSLNVNRTCGDLCEGVDVESLEDFDTFTTGKPVESTEDLEREVDE